MKETLMHIMSRPKRMRRITATLGDRERGGESLRVSAFKYLNHAPVTPFLHVDVSVYQNEGWQKTSVLVCVQTACVDGLMEPAALMYFLQLCKIQFKAVWSRRNFHLSGSNFVLQQHGYDIVHVALIHNSSPSVPRWQADCDYYPRPVEYVTHEVSRYVKITLNIFAMEPSFPKAQQIAASRIPSHPNEVWKQVSGKAGSNSTVINGQIRQSVRTVT